jgi:type IV pilus assembly protein PilQ
VTVGERQVPQAQQAPATAPAAPLGPAPQSGTRDVQPAEQRFTGHPVSLDFQGADLRSVLRTFSEISGLNLVIDPSIQGSVDVSLRDVPWDQALDIILRANRLGYVVDGTIVRVAPLAVLADEETQRRKLQDEQALAGELRVMSRSLSYARAEDLKALLTATALSQRGTIQTDARTNTIIINDLADRLERAGSLITSLDVPQPQVEIEARIVQTSRSFASSLGVKWGISGRAIPGLGNTLPLAFPNSVATGAGVDLNVPAAPSTATLALGSINGALNLDVALSALERSGQGRILSTPRVSTQNNIEAEITQGIQIPIQTVANNTVTVSFRDAALTLKVTPQITASSTVIMRIQVANESPDFSRQVNGIPPIDTQRAVTQVLVSDGETTVIGGIYVSREQATQDRTPGLYRLPLLGWLFKRNLTEDESRELLIFITPKIARL